MSLLDLFRGGSTEPSPKAATQDRGGGVIINSPDQLAEAIRQANVTSSGMSVTPSTAMKVATVYACVRIRAGIVANMPLRIRKRVSDKVNEDLPDHALWTLLTKKPNRWQTPSQFRRMAQSHVLLRGYSCALKVKSRGAVRELVPLHPDRLTCEQLDDLSLKYTYRLRNGGTTVLGQEDVFHLVGLTLDGVHGVSPITYARETIGLALAMEDHGAKTFRNGARPSTVLSHPSTLGPEGLENLRASLDDYRLNGESEGKTLILEEGVKPEQLSLSAVDAQWIESRKFTRTDIAMFYGVPPHMLGDTEKDTSWGTGIEQQTMGFINFTAEDDLTMWEQTIDRDLIGGEQGVYARFNRKALIRGDIKSRQEFYRTMWNIGVYSANDIRAKEDENPREGGDEYYTPINMTDGSNAAADNHQQGSDQ